jgi:hypothetical protein
MFSVSLHCNSHFALKEDYFLQTAARLDARGQERQVLSVERQICSRLQRSHLGLRASQTWRP